MSWDGGHRECERGADAAPFVLDALGQEEPEYRAHLATCAICRAEVFELRRVIEAVPSTAPVSVAPEDLRMRVMAIVHAEAELLRAAGPDADVVRGARRRWRPRLGSLAAAGGLAVAAAVAVGIIGFPAAQSIRTIPAHVAAASPVARAVLRESNDRGELVLSGMPPPPSGETYEVWVRRGGDAIRPTDALFSVDSRGQGSVDVPGSLSGVREVLVSAEPLGGSSRLTGAVLISVRVRS
jgi:hypothetical protein